MTRAELDRAAAKLIQRDIHALAPGMIPRVEAFLAECATDGLPVAVNETVRSNPLQVLYYSYGRDDAGHVIGETITNASDASRSWHGYALALDICHKTKGYTVPMSWWSRVAAVAQRHGLDWGGHWTHPDYPHFQHGALPASPTIQDRDDFHRGDLAAVYARYGIAP